MKMTEEVLGAIEATGPYIIAKLLGAEEISTVLVVPESMRARRGQATVLDVGPDAPRLAPGFRIVFKDYANIIKENVVTQVSGIILDKASGTISVHKKQVLAYTMPESWQMHAYDDHVIAKLNLEPETTESGLFVPESARNPNGIWATVVSVGYGVDRLEVGDQIRVKDHTDLVVTKERPVFLNHKEGLISVYRPQIVARIPRQFVAGDVVS